MLIMDVHKSPIVEHGAKMDGMIYRPDGTTEPGAILKLWAEVRARVGVVAAKKKDGVRFKVRSAEDLIDKLREVTNELGVLVYPASADGKGHPLEEGTLAEVTLGVVAQALEDGSRLYFAGFGLGADNQDKAGGKAGTYAFKQALIQALLAGGSKNAKALGVADTDDTDTPIAGGVRKKSARVSVADVTKRFEAAETLEDYKAAVKLLSQLKPEEQLSLKPVVVEAKARTSNKG